MKPPWKSANANRPSVSPSTIVPALVGVEYSRREMPYRRVVMSATAPVIEVRNMNRMTWLSAPTA